MANCTGCGAEILWSVSEKGNRVPLDAKSEKRFVKLSGPGNGQSIAVKVVDTYVSHFVTCPQAHEFRKDKSDG